jgi:hypothetical protein
VRQPLAVGTREERDDRQEVVRQAAGLVEVDGGGIFSFSVRLLWSTTAAGFLRCRWRQQPRLLGRRDLLAHGCRTLEGPHPSQLGILLYYILDGMEMTLP